MMHHHGALFYARDMTWHPTDELAEGLVGTVKEAVLIAVKEPERITLHVQICSGHRRFHRTYRNCGRASDFASHAIEQLSCAMT